jgi:PTH1 family peptidyl-tRNA hydrolase
MKLIVGLGNPGREYKNTRHNIGFKAVEEIASFLKIEFDKKKFGGSYAEALYGDEKIIILKPEKYMNLSGGVVKDFIRYFKIAIDDMLIIYDDLDTDVGKYRLRSQGGSGGHNGIRDIEEQLKTQIYKRIKIGIAKNIDIEASNYVLGKFTKEEIPLMDKALDDIIPIFKDYFVLSFENLMNKYN